jgi:hypothetical protein
MGGATIGPCIVKRPIGVAYVKPALKTEILFGVGIDLLGDVRVSV